MSNSLADTSYYYQSGQIIFQGLNPYSGDLPFYSGPAGGWFLYVIGKIFFIETFPLVWQIINLAGVSIFFYTILAKFGVQRNLILLIGMMLLSSPVREMVVNNQVTGFVLGIAAFVIQTSSRNVHSAVIAVNSILLYLVFELKPNLILGFVVYFVVTNKERIFWIILPVTSFFAVFNLLLADNIYLKWLNYIRSQGVGNLTGYESLGLSTFIYESGILNKENARILGVSLFLLCLVPTVVAAFSNRIQGLLVTIPLLAIFFPYLHYLDFAIAVPFIVFYVFYRTNLSSLSPIVIVVLYLPRPTHGIIKNLFILAILVIVFVVDFSRFRSGWKAMIGILVGAALLLSNFLIDSYVRGEHQLQSMTVLRAWIIISFVLIWQSINEQWRDGLNQDDYPKHKTNHNRK